MISSIQSTIGFPLNFDWKLKDFLYHLSEIGIFFQKIITSKRFPFKFNQEFLSIWIKLKDFLWIQNKRFPLKCLNKDWRISLTNQLRFPSFTLRPNDRIFFQVPMILKNFLWNWIEIYFTIRLRWKDFI